MSFGFHPAHIATRGRLGGQYAIATRGYLVRPDIVPRFPADADLFVEEGDLGAVEPMRLRGELFDHDPLFADLDFDTNQRGFLSEDQVRTLLATIESLDPGATVWLEDVRFGEAVVLDDEAELVLEGDIGSATEDDEGATLDLDDPVGETEDDPPSC